MSKSYDRPQATWPDVGRLVLPCFAVGLIAGVAVGIALVVSPLIWSAWQALMEWMS